MHIRTKYSVFNLIDYENTEVKLNKKAFYDK